MFDLTDFSNRYRETNFSYASELKTAECILNSRQQVSAAISGRFSPLTALLRSSDFSARSAHVSLTCFVIGSWMNYCYLRQGGYGFIVVRVSLCVSVCKISQTGTNGFRRRYFQGKCLRVTDEPISFWRESGLFLNAGSFSRILYH